MMIPADALQEDRRLRLREHVRGSDRTRLVENYAADINRHRGAMATGERAMKEPRGIQDIVVVYMENRSFDRETGYLSMRSMTMLAAPRLGFTTR
jgi:phospholipase C